MFPRLIGEGRSDPARGAALFENPFSIEDLLVFDDAAMQHMLSSECLRLAVEDLAWSLHGASKTLVERVRDSLSLHKRDHFCADLRRPISGEQVKDAQRRVRDLLCR